MHHPKFSFTAVNASLNQRLALGLNFLYAEELN